MFIKKIKKILGLWSVVMCFVSHAKAIENSIICDFKIAAPFFANCNANFTQKTQEVDAMFDNAQFKAPGSITSLGYIINYKDFLCGISVQVEGLKYYNKCRSNMTYEFLKKLQKTTEGKQMVEEAYKIIGTERLKEHVNDAEEVINKYGSGKEPNLAIMSEYLNDSFLPVFMLVPTLGVNCFKFDYRIFVGANLNEDWWFLFKFNYMPQKIISDPAANSGLERDINKHKIYTEVNLTETKVHTINMESEFNCRAGNLMYFSFFLGLETNINSPKIGFNLWVENKKITLESTDFKIKNYYLGLGLGVKF